MPRITDTLLVGPEEIGIIRNRYPDCQFCQLTFSDHKIQQFRLIIDVESEDGYFNFLLDNCIAMSSKEFYMRVKTDKRFAARMKARLDGGE